LRVPGFPVYLLSVKIGSEVDREFLDEVGDFLRTRLPEWRSLFPSRYVGRGRSYWEEGAVTIVGVRGGLEGFTVDARVEGSTPEPYKTRIDLFVAGKSGATVASDCSCPMVTGCKHVVAILFALERDTGNLHAPVESRDEDRSTTSLVRDEPSSPDPRLPHRLRQWVEEVGEAADRPPAGDSTPGGGPQTIEPGEEGLVYQFEPYNPMVEEARGGFARLGLVRLRRNRSGEWGKRVSHPRTPDFPGGNWPKIFGMGDRRIVGRMETLRHQFHDRFFYPEGGLWERPVRAVLETGGAVWRQNWDRPFSRGEHRLVETAWIPGERGEVHSALCFAGSGSPAWLIDMEEVVFYLDPATDCWGEAELLLPGAVTARQWWDAPPVDAVRVPVVRQALEKWADHVPPERGEPGRRKGKGKNPGKTDRPCLRLPPEIEITVVEGSEVPVRGHLRVVRADVENEYYRRIGRLPHLFRADVDLAELPCAEVTFRYGNHVVPLRGASAIEQCRVDDKLFEIRHDDRKESELLTVLEEEGLVPVFLHPGLPMPDHSKAEPYVTFEEEHRNERLTQRWIQFVVGARERMREAGWDIELDEGFGLSLHEPESWWSDFGEDEGAGVEWLRFDYGFEVEGRRVSLLSLLSDYLSRLPVGTDPETALGEYPGGAIPLVLAGGEDVVAVPVEKLLEILRTVTEIFDTELVDGGLPLHSLRAAQIAAEWDGVDERNLGKRIRDLRDRIVKFDGVASVPVPAGLQAELRPYQVEGMSWLQFLREFGLGGILADDMGLGKTVQSLASILHEKEAERTGRCPSLVVAPTSVLSNWVDEAGRFAPGLSVLLLHGPDRRSWFSEIGTYDLVVTSYPLLVRDEEALAAHSWHYVVLDEAQTIKNPKAKMAQAACSLDARHRLCLTGTPVENHLGEMWSLLHFLVPGFFGTLDVFRKVWQRPIEQKGDTFKRDALARRVSPLLLRRTRDKVLGELPPRTDIVRRIPFEKSQAQLYESVRAAMDKRVREALAHRGLARSHIVILDALLKLRQVCCDPRLLKTESARQVKKWAKAEEFLSLLRDLVEEGRRVLVFSQFTSMLAILREILDAEGIPFLELTGRTRKRAEKIAAFEAGEAPVFLISLKAGGTGLNLTSADAVIHYDPWWNPAVEEQATARAHRMGQKKPVFVYRLVIEGSIEERILELQEKKAELAGAILSGGREEGGPGLGALDREGLEALLAPAGS